MNLHRSYPTSTSSSRNRAKVPETGGATTQIRAEERTEVSHSGDSPPIPRGRSASRRSSRHGPPRNGLESGAGAPRSRAVLIQSMWSRSSSRFGHRCHRGRGHSAGASVETERGRGDAVLRSRAGRKEPCSLASQLCRTSATTHRSPSCTWTRRRYPTPRRGSRWPRTRRKQDGCSIG